MAHTSVWWQTRWQLCKHVTIRLSHKAKVRLVAVSTLQVSNLALLRVRLRTRISSCDIYYTTATTLLLHSLLELHIIQGACRQRRRRRQQRSTFTCTTQRRPTTTLPKQHTSVCIGQRCIVMHPPRLNHDHMQTRTGNIHHKQLHNLRQCLHFDMPKHIARYRRSLPARTIHIAREGMNLQLMLCYKCAVYKALVSPTIKQHTSGHVSHQPRQSQQPLLRIARGSTHTQLRQRWHMHFSGRRVMPNLNIPRRRTQGPLVALEPSLCEKH